MNDNLGENPALEKKIKDRLKQREKETMALIKLLSAVEDKYATKVAIDVQLKAKDASLKKQ